MVHSLSIGRWRKPCALRFVFKPACTTVWLAALSTAAFTAQAQPAAPTIRPDPLDAKASVPALTYPSSLSQYRRLDDGKLISWREANDTVARIGGWRVYAREAQQPDPPLAPEPAGSAAAAVSNETAKPMPAGHGGHKTP